MDAERRKEIEKYITGYNPQDFDRIALCAGIRYGRLVARELLAEIDRLEAELASRVLIKHTADERPKKTGRYLCDIKYHPPYKGGEKKMIWRLWTRKMGGYWVHSSIRYDVLAWYEEK